jgi:hypothetical protein
MKGEEPETRLPAVIARQATNNSLKCTLQTAVARCNVICFQKASHGFGMLEEGKVRTAAA